MSYSIYKLIHLSGVLLIFLSFGGLIARGFLNPNEKKLKRLGGITNGLGLTLTLIGGMGLIAKLEIGFPIWVLAKLTIWIIFAIFIILINRKPEFGTLYWGALIFSGILALYLAINKPF